MPSGIDPSASTVCQAKPNRSRTMPWGREPLTVGAAGPQDRPGCSLRPLCARFDHVARGFGRAPAGASALHVCVLSCTLLDGCCASGWLLRMQSAVRSAALASRTRGRPKLAVAMRETAGSGAC